MGGWGGGIWPGWESCIGLATRSIDLIAVCDRNLENANDLADEARALLGTRPQVFASVAEMAAGADGLEAADCTTDTGSHHIVATELLAAGLHTLVEKPIALTVKGALQIINASQKTGAILSVAENFRRDPMNRLVKALLDDGAIGEPNTIMEVTVGGRDSIIITPWRHQKLTGTITVDAGVHNADMLTVLLRRCCDRVRPDPAASSGSGPAGDGWSGWLVREVGDGHAGSDRGDRRGCNPRFAPVRERAGRPLGAASRGSRRANAKSAYIWKLGLNYRTG